jgi:hypothetical protein
MSSCSSMILHVKAVPLDVVLCVQSIVVFFKHLLASDTANLCLHLLMLQESLFCSKLLNFFMSGLMEAFPKLLFVVVVLTFAFLFLSYCSCLFFGFPPYT